MSGSGGVLRAELCHPSSAWHSQEAVSSDISAVNMIICNYSINNGWLEKSDAEKRGAGSKLLAWVRGGGHQVAC